MRYLFGWIICLFKGHMYHSVKRDENNTQGFSIFGSDGRKYCLRCKRWGKYVK